jgi:Lsr2
MSVAGFFDIEAVSLDGPGMARTVSVVISDDLDRSPGAQAVAFGFGGRSYQIGLGKKNRARFQKSLQPFMDAGRASYSAQDSERFPGYRTGERQIASISPELSTPSMSMPCAR